MYVLKGLLDGLLIVLGGCMKIDDKDCEGGDFYGVIGVKLMEYVFKVRKVFVIGGVDEKMVKDVV